MRDLVMLNPMWPKLSRASKIFFLFLFFFFFFFSIRGYVMSVKWNLIWCSQPYHILIDYPLDSLVRRESYRRFYLKEMWYWCYRVGDIRILSRHIVWQNGHKNAVRVATLQFMRHGQSVTTLPTGSTISWKGI